MWKKNQINNQQWLTTRMSLSDKELFPPTRLRQHLRDLQKNLMLLIIIKILIHHRNMTYATSNTNMPMYQQHWLVDNTKQYPQIFHIQRFTTRVSLYIIISQCMHTCHNKTKGLNFTMFRSTSHSLHLPTFYSNARKHNKTE